MRIHQSLLAGLLSHVGLKEPEDKKRRFEYLGARGAKFSIAPGSSLFKSAPQWVVAAELVETQPIVGPGGRQDRTGLGRTPRQPSGQAQLQRAALVQETGGGAGQRAGDPVRHPDRGSPAGQLRAHRSGAVPRAVHPARPGGGRLGHPSRVLQGQPGVARRSRGHGTPGPPPGHPGRRRDPVRLLRSADSLRRGIRPSFRLVVEAGPPGRPGPARLRPGDAHQRRNRLRPGRVPGRAGRSAADVTSSNPGSRPTASPFRYRSPGSRRWHRPSSTGRYRGCARIWSRRSSSRCPSRCGSSWYRRRIMPARCWPG